MLATAALDLTQAILIGLAVSAIIHLRLEADAASVTVVPVDPERLPNARFTVACAGVRVAYVNGALFLAMPQLCGAPYNSNKIATL
jgi:SulP family sulfate permease